MAWWTALAGQGAAQMGKLDDALTGMALGKFGDNRQYFQQKRLQGLAVRGQKELADYEQKLAMEMWENTGPAAQREQIEKAGLNVGLMMGGAGGGGGRSQGASVGNVGNANAAPGSQDILQAMEIGQQARMMAAQTQLIEAQTQKTKAETVKTSGVDTEKTTGEIAKLAAETQNEGLKANLLKFQGTIEGVNARVATANEQELINELRNANEMTVQQIREQASKANVAEETQNAMISQVKTATIEQMLRIKATKAGIINTQTATEATNAGIKKIGAEIAMMSETVRKQWREWEQAEKERWIKEKLAGLQGTSTDFATGTAAEIQRWVKVVTDVIDSGN